MGSADTTRAGVVRSDATLHDAVRALSAMKRVTLPRLPLERLHDVPAELERALLNARIVQLDAELRVACGGWARDAAIASESKKFDMGPPPEKASRSRSGTTRNFPKNFPAKSRGRA